MVLILFLFVFFGKILAEPLPGPSVKIIGAGPAGIAAATKLLEHSITNITILEAEDRIGGRIHSVFLEDGYVDLGAEFCHGEVGNVVYETVKDLDLLRHSSDFPGKIIYQSDGNRIDEEFAADLFQFIDNYSNWIDNTNSQLSLGVNLDQIYETKIIKKYNKTRKLKSAEVKLLQHAILSHEGSFSLETVSAARHYQACPGDQTLRWKNGGYHTILSLLIKKQSKSNQLLDKISLNKEVINISWQGLRAEIKTFDNVTYTADYIIFTPSVGVLKHNTKLFTPSLPKKKLNSLGCLGLDAIIKIIVHYPRKWWNTNLFLFSWSPEDLRKSAEEFPHGYTKNGISWITSVFALTATTNPNVLIALITGEMVPEIEKIPENVIAEGIEFLTEKFLGKDYNVTKPDRVIRSQWYSNRHFKGTYSFEKLGCFEPNISHQAVLAEPIYKNNGKIMVQFAGEATHPIHYSTVHGAIESGWREAERIISLYKNK